jgi:hypothetical protein
MRTTDQVPNEFQSDYIGFRHDFIPALDSVQWLAMDERCFKFEVARRKTSLSLNPKSVGTLEYV